MKKVIKVNVDKPAMLAKRIVDRLERDHLIPPSRPRSLIDAYMEAIADEIHQDILDATCGGA